MDNSNSAMETIDSIQQSLIELLNTIGEYRIEKKKTSLHVVHGRAFIGIHPKKSYLGINIVLARADAMPSASKVEQVSASRYHHFYKITTKKELTKSFTKLLKEAYLLTLPKE